MTIENAAPATLPVGNVSVADATDAGFGETDHVVRQPE